MIHQMKICNRTREHDAPKKKTDLQSIGEVEDGHRRQLQLSRLRIHQDLCHDGYRAQQKMSMKHHETLDGTLRLYNFLNHIHNMNHINRLLDFVSAEVFLKFPAVSPHRLEFSRETPKYRHKSPVQIRMWHPRFWLNPSSVNCCCDGTKIYGQRWCSSCGPCIQQPAGGFQGCAGGFNP